MAETAPIRRIGAPDSSAPLIALRSGIDQGGSRPPFIGPLLPQEGDRDPFMIEGMAVITEDGAGFTSHLLKNTFGPNLDPQKKEAALEATRTSFPPLVELYRTIWPGRVFPITEAQIENFLASKINYLSHLDPNRIFAKADRYIGQGLKEKYDGVVYDVSGTRTGGNAVDPKTGENLPSPIVARPGDPPIPQQLDTIVDDLQKRGRPLSEVTVSIVDDSFASGSTAKAWLKEFESVGIRGDSSNGIFGYIIGMKKPIIGIDDAHVLGENKDRVDAKEQREKTPLGGTLVREARTPGIALALQEPAQGPWGDGEMNRINGLIQLTDIDIQLLQMYRDLLGKMETALAGELRPDGSPFTNFSLADIRYMIPHSKATTSGVGATEAIRQHREKYFAGNPDGNPDKFPINASGESLHLSDIKVIDLLDHAIDLLKEKPKTSRIGHVVESVNGTQLALQYPDENRRRFTSSALYAAVNEKTKRIVDGYLEEYPGRSINPELLDHPGRLVKNFDFASYLYETYNGQLVWARLEKRFAEFYGQERGPDEMRSFLEETSHLPFAYHILQEATWGQVEVDQTHIADPDKQALRFNQSLVDEGVKLTFLSTAPRIQVMDVLLRSGQAELVRSGQAELLTLENLIDPETLQKTEKKDVIVAIARRNRWGKVLSIGDQPFVDVRPVAEKGGSNFQIFANKDSRGSSDSDLTAEQRERLYKQNRAAFENAYTDRAGLAKTYLVSGPHDLAAAREYIRTPKQKMPVTAEDVVDGEEKGEAPQGKAEASSSHEINVYFNRLNGNTSA